MRSGIKWGEGRDQGSGGCDLGSQPWDQGSETMGSGSAVFLGIRDMGIRLYHICRIRDQSWSRIWSEGSEICVQKWDQH